MQAIDTFDPIERYVGAGNLDEYDFNFLITESSQLLVIVLDSDDEEIERFRANEVDDFFTNLEFDETDGGGTITLTDDLPTGYTLILLLAPDEPLQDSNFTAQGVFNLAFLQAALNKLGALIQRVSWVSQRSLRLHDAFNQNFDPQLPLELEAGRSFVIDEDLDGMFLVPGPTMEEMLAAVTAAEDAEAARALAVIAQTAAEDAQIEAEAAQAAAEAAQAAAELAADEAELAAGGFITVGPQTVNQNASTALTGEVTASGTYTQVDYMMRIVRGTTVFGRAEFSIFFRNGAWELVSGADRYAVTALGVTFTVHATTGQITAVVDNGAGNATITGKKINWPA